VTAQDDDLLGAEPLGGDHAAQADRTVADDSDGLPRADPRGERRVVAGSHHVRKREKRRHQCVVLPDRQDDERPVCLGDTHGLALAAVDAVAGPPPAVKAGGVQPFVAEDAGAVGPRERRDHDVTDLDVADVAADRVDDPDELVAHALARLAVFHLVVGPEIAAADTGACDGDEGVGRFDEAGVGDGLDTDVAGAVHDSCAHVEAAFRVESQKNVDGLSHLLRCPQQSCPWAATSLKHGIAPGDRPC